MKLIARFLIGLVLLLGGLLGPPPPAEASVTVGTISVIEFNNACDTGVFDNGDTLKVSVPIANNEGSASFFHVVIRMRGTNIATPSETVDGAYGGPLYVYESISPTTFDDSFSLVVNTPIIPDGNSYTVVGFLGLHKQFMGDVLGFGEGDVNVDVEVYKYNQAGSATDMLGYNTTSVHLVNRSNKYKCNSGKKVQQLSTGIVVTDKTDYGIGDTVTIEWGAMGGDDSSHRPVMSELGKATVEIRRLSGFPSGDPVFDFDNATPVTSLSTWTEHIMAADACKTDEGVSLSFCYSQSIGTQHGATGYNTYTTQSADSGKYLIIKLGEGSGTPSHTTHAQYNYFYVDPPTAVHLSSFTARSGLSAAADRDAWHFWPWVGLVGLAALGVGRVVWMTRR